jgi:hypothetical protein
MKQSETDPLPTTTTSSKEYLVESILGKKEHNGTLQFLIKWEGYGDEFNAWEDEKNLNCVVAEFEKKWNKRRGPERRKKRG